MSTGNGNSEHTLSPEFCALVVKELAALGLKVKQWKDNGLDVEDSAGGSSWIGLTNLYKRVQVNDAADAPAIVRDFLKHLATMQGPPKIPDTLEEAGSQLLIRIGQAFAKDMKGPWAQPLAGAPGLQINLVIDFPNMMAFVPKEKIEKSAKPADEWVRVAIDNLKECTPDDWLDVASEEDGIYASHLEDSYDAARALIIADHPETGPHGWLVCVPSRDWLFAMKVDIEGLATFHLLKILADRNNANQPYPISNKVYWIRPDEPWLEFPIEIDEESIRVIPPPEFIDALNLAERLEEAEGEGESEEEEDDA